MNCLNCNTPLIITEVSDNFETRNCDMCGYGKLHNLKTGEVFIGDCYPSCNIYYRSE